MLLTEEDETVYIICVCALVAHGLLLWWLAMSHRRTRTWGLVYGGVCVACLLLLLAKSCATHRERNAELLIGRLDRQYRQQENGCIPVYMLSAMELDALRWRLLKSQDGTELSHDMTYNRLCLFNLAWFKGPAGVPGCRGAAGVNATFIIGAERVAVKAHAGQDQALTFQPLYSDCARFPPPVEDCIVLNGTQSTGLDLRYTWKQTDGDPLLYACNTMKRTPTTGLFDTDKAVACFVPALSGPYSFQLHVTDGVTSDTAVVTVVAVKSR